MTGLSMTGGEGALERLGFAAGQVVQEFGWDDDVDEAVRRGIEAVTGETLEDEDFDEGSDAVLVWFRDGDDDLTDLLVDAAGTLFDSGCLVLATPRAGRAGAVEASDIEEAAATAGLVVGAPAKVSSTWSLVRLMPPRQPSGKGHR